MAEPKKSEPDLKSAKAGESPGKEFPGATIYRWRIWSGRPLFRAKSESVLHVDHIPPDIKPYRFPANVLLLVGHFLLGTTISLLLWAILPFALIWFAGTLAGHSDKFVATMSSLVWMLIFLVVVTSAVLLGRRSKDNRSETETLRAAYAALALPLLMYVTATGNPEGFETFGEVAVDPFRFWVWLGFYAYMYADILSFGGIESLVGKFASLQPASVEAAVFTFLTRFLMTVSLLFHAYKYLSGRVFAAEDFSGDTQTMLKRLQAVATPRASCYAMPLATETPLGKDRQPTPAQEWFRRAGRKLRSKPMDLFKGPVGRFVFPGVVLQAVALLVVIGLLILEVLPFGSRFSIFAIAALLIVGIPFLFATASKVLSKALEVKCTVQVHELLSMCRNYQVEYGRYPDSLAELGRVFPMISRQLVCPAKLKEEDIRPGLEGLPIEEALRLTSYRYLRPDPTVPPSSSVPLIYEVEGRHGGTRKQRCCNVVFQDGRIESMRVDDLNTLLEKLAEV